MKQKITFTCICGKCKPRELTAEEQKEFNIIVKEFKKK